MKKTLTIVIVVVVSMVALIALAHNLDIKALINLVHGR